LISIDMKMAWRNIWRNPRRSILTITAIAFAGMLLVFMLSWQFGSYEIMINSAVKVHTGHLQVQAKDYQRKRSIHLVVPDPVAVQNLLAETPHVTVVTGRANAFALVSSKERTYGVLVTGIDPVREARVSTLEKLVRRGSYLAAEDTDQALVGRLLARNLKVDPGDELVVLGQGRDGSIAATVIRVKGIFSSGQDDFDRRAMHLPLAYFQEVFNMRGAVNEVVAIVDALAHVPEIKATVEAGLENIGENDGLVVLDWKELMPGLIEGIKMDLVGGFIFYLILIVVVAFSILNTFLMAILERTREFGVLLAIGASHRRLTKILIFESGGMTVLGILAGVIAGSLVTLYFQAHGIHIPGSTDILRQYGLPDRIYPQLSFLSAFIGPGVVLLITLLAALYPALKVKRLKPVEAMTAV